MRILIIIFSFIGFWFWNSIVIGQKPLEYEKKENIVYMDGVKMSMDDLFMLMYKQEDAFKMLKASRDNKAYSTVFSTLGGGALGFSLGYFLISGKPEWISLTAGASLIGLAVPIHLKHKRLLGESAEVWNQHIGLHQSKSNNTPTIAFAINNTTIGVSLSF